MITISKQDNGVLFTFENSDKYLYGNGTILVPFNSLSIIADESDMITLRKSASNDIFLSARYDTDLGYRSKDDAIDDLKDLLFAETGGGSESGITSGQVQSMIDESISGKADTSDVTAVANDVQTVSGQVATKVNTTDFNAYSAATDSRLAEDEEVTAAALNDLQENKADTSAVTAVNDALTAHTSNTGIHVTSADKTAWNSKSDFSGDYNDLTNKPTIPTVPTNISDFTNDAGYITNADIAGKADTSAVTAAIDAAITGKVDTSAITSSVTSASTDTQIPTAKAVYDAIPTGGGATYSAGTNISIDTGNTINCTLNLNNGSGADSIVGNSSTALGKKSFAFAGGEAGTGSSVDTCFAIGYACKAKKNRTFAFGSTNNINEINSAAFGINITLKSPFSFAAGGYITSSGWYNTAFGEYTRTDNRNEFGCGVYNNSVTGSTASGQTLFSVGNGTANNARHNAFEIRQNGDIYVNDGTNDVRLQDTITATASNTTALGGLKFVKLTQSEYDQLATKDNDTLYIISNVVS